MRGAIRACASQMSSQVGGRKFADSTCGAVLMGRLAAFEIFHGRACGGSRATHYLTEIAPAGFAGMGKAAAPAGQCGCDRKGQSAACMRFPLCQRLRKNGNCSPRPWGGTIFGFSATAMVMN